MSRYSIPTQGDFKKETIPSNSSDQETKESKNTYRKNNHFDKSTETSLLEDSFNKLLTGEYIHPNSTLQQWTYICTGQGDGNIEPLKWISTNRELAYLIDRLFGKSNSGNLWAVTFNCFYINGKKPNKGTLKNYISTMNNSYIYSPDNL